MNRSILKRILIIIILIIYSLSFFSGVVLATDDEREFPIYEKDPVVTPPDSKRRSIYEEKYYPKTTDISGHVYEKVESRYNQAIGQDGKDSSSNIYLEGISDIKLNLEITGVSGGYETETYSKQDGSFSFGVNGLSGLYNYTIKYTLPSLENGEQTIDNIRTVNEAKKIQKNYNIMA